MCFVSFLLLPTWPNDVYIYYAVIVLRALREFTLFTAETAPVAADLWTTPIDVSQSPLLGSMWTTYTIARKLILILPSHRG